MGINTKAATEVTAHVPAGVAPSQVASATVAEESIPAIGAFRTDDHRYFFNGEGPYPSVTSILRILDKPAIGISRMQKALRAAYRAGQEDGRSEWQRMTEEEAIKWAVKQADDERDLAANLGSSVHLLADLAGASETASEGWQTSEQEKPYLEAYKAFLARYGGSQSIVSSEHMVWSISGYAGTYDLLMMIDTRLWLIDIKTGRDIYPDHGLQLAAYRWADSIIVPGIPTPYPMPNVHRTGVLHLRPDKYEDTGWRLIEYPTTERDYIAFTAALELYRWQKEGRFTKRRLAEAQTPQEQESASSH